MLRRTVLLVALLALAAWPLLEQVEAEQRNANGVVADTVNSININPQSVDEGGAVSIQVILGNENIVPAEDVFVEFHKNSYSGGAVPANQQAVDIPAEDVRYVNWSWTGLAASDDRIYVHVSYDGANFLLNKSFTVVAKPDLTVGMFTVDPSSDVRPGDNVTLAAQVCNTGGAAAGASTTRLEFENDLQEDVATPGLAPASCAWANATVEAPVAATWNVIASADIASVVDESDENDNSRSTTLTIAPRPDYSHNGTVSVTVPPNSLTGPWTLNGTVSRDRGDGPTNVTLAIRHTGLGELARTSVAFGGTGAADATWSLEVPSSPFSTLGVGQHQVTVLLDPDNDLDQPTLNDAATANLRVIQEPNVRVDSAISLATEATTVLPGSSVTWRVTVTNQGELPTSGLLTALWSGAGGDNEPVSLAPFESKVIEFTLAAPGTETESAVFTATYTTSSWDRNPLDNEATRSLRIATPFSLAWVLQSESIQFEGTPITPPLLLDREYTYLLDITSTGAGTESFECVDRGSGEVYERMTLTFATGESKRLSCTFTPIETGSLLLGVVAGNGTVTSRQLTYSVVLSASDGVEDGDDPAGSENFLLVAALLLGGFAVLLIIVFIASIYLSRPIDEDVERDIFEYCPSCNGELEGDEAECPHCGLDLHEALSQFHDCENCNETVPDVIEFCPVCGTPQHPERRFERRAMKTSGRLEAMPTASRTLVDDDAIVKGTQDYDEAVSGFGIKEGALEKEWEKESARADRMMEEMLDRRDQRAAASSEVGHDDDVSSPLLRDQQYSRDRDLDAFLPDRDTRRSLADDDVEFTASDADYRADLYALTGEEGVMPGERVEISGDVEGDSSIAGNELRPSTADFGIKSGGPRRVRTRGAEDTPEETPSKGRPRRRASRDRAKEEDDEPQPTPSGGRRRAARRRAAPAAEDPTAATHGTCPSCGSNVDVTAPACTVCGHPFA